MTYRAHVDGFTGHFDTVAAVQTWLNDLHANHGGIKGRTLKIWRALWVARDGSGAQYASAPTFTSVL